MPPLKVWKADVSCVSPSSDALLCHRPDTLKMSPFLLRNSIIHGNNAWAGKKKKIFAMVLKMITSLHANLTWIKENLKLSHWNVMHLFSFFYVNVSGNTNLTAGWLLAYRQWLTNTVRCFALNSNYSPYLLTFQCAFVSAFKKFTRFSRTDSRIW